MLLFRIRLTALLRLLLLAYLALPAAAQAALVIDRQKFPGFATADGAWHFLFSPKDAKTWSYVIRSNHPGLDGRRGGITSQMPAPARARAREPAAGYPHWWTDDPAPAAAAAGHPGARHVSRWREAFLRDFAPRLLRCQSPASR